MSARSPVDSRPYQRCKLRRAGPDRRRPGFAPDALLSTADRRRLRFAHQPAPTIGVEVFAPAIRADERTEPRTRSAVLFHAFQRIAAMTAVQMQGADVVDGLQTFRRKAAGGIRLKFLGSWHAD